MVFSVFLCLKSIRILYCFVSSLESRWIRLSISNEPFYFITEENPIVAGSIDQNKQIRFFFMLLLAATSVLVLGAYFYTVFHSTVSNKVNHAHLVSSDRELATVENVAIDGQSVSQNQLSLLPIVKLDSLLVRLTDGQHIRLSRVDIVLHISDLNVKKEIQDSINKVRDHLIFILSAQNESVFVDTKKKAMLEQEIIHQLNLFLMTGKVKKIQLQQTFLS